MKSADNTDAFSEHVYSFRSNQDVTFIGRLNDAMRQTNIFFERLREKHETIFVGKLWGNHERPQNIIKNVGSFSVVKARRDVKECAEGKN